MKISEVTPKDDIQKIQSSSSDRQVRKTEDFKSMFEGELNALTEAVEASGGSEEAFMTVNSGMEISAVWNADAVWNEMQAAESAGRTAVEKLQTIGRLVEDGQPDLKRIDVILGELTKEAGDLEAQVKHLPEGHPLRSLSDELSVLAYVESVKWKRGDYL